MNRIWISLLMCFGLLVASCKKDQEPVLFEIPYQVDFEIPAGLNTFETHIIEVNNIPSRMEESLNARGLTVEDIQRIDPKSARLSNLLADGTYDFIREASIELFIPRAVPLPNNRDSLITEVFWHPQISTNTGIDLDVPATLSDAKRLLTKERINIRVKLILRDFSPTFLSTRMRLEFAVR
ncbi:MAG: hypothetical protein AAFP19_19510 [Bacteroidota bacterium]